MSATAEDYYDDTVVVLLPPIRRTANRRPSDRSACPLLHLVGRPPDKEKVAARPPATGDRNGNESAWDGAAGQVQGNAPGVEDHLGLVRMVTSRYWKNDSRCQTARRAGVLDFEDLVSHGAYGQPAQRGAGVGGLARALETWDPAKGKLSTHAVPHIESAISRTLDYLAAVAVPERSAQELRGASARGDTLTPDQTRVKAMLTGARRLDVDDNGRISGTVPTNRPGTVRYHGHGDPTATAMIVNVGEIRQADDLECLCPRPDLRTGGIPDHSAIGCPFNNRPPTTWWPHDGATRSKPMLQPRYGPHTGAWSGFPCEPANWVLNGRPTRTRPHEDMRPDEPIRDGVHRPTDRSYEQGRQYRAERSAMRLAAIAQEVTS